MFLRAVRNERKRRQKLGASSQVDKVRFHSQMFQNVKYEAAIPDGSFQVPVGAKTRTLSSSPVQITTSVNKPRAETFICIIISICVCSHYP